MKPEQTASQLTIKKIELGNLMDVAKIHKRAFPDSALSKLGLEATRRYYEWQLLGPHDTYAIGVFEDDLLLGFCFGGVFRGALNGFLNKNKKFLILLVASHPWLLFNPIFFERVKIAFRSLYQKKKAIPAPSLSTDNHKPAFGILSIAVDPLQQRRNLGRMLMERSEAEALEKGFSRMGLTVHPNNSKAIGFYESLGWIRRNDPSGNWSGSMEKHLS